MHAQIRSDQRRLEEFYVIARDPRRAGTGLCGAGRVIRQFPSRMPLDATPFTRAFPLASSGASSPLSAASTASFRTAVIRTLMETVPSPRASRETRQEQLESRHIG